MKKPTKLDALEQVQVHSRAEWRAWLKKHHKRDVGIWLVFYKKSVPDKYVGWDVIVEEALCFGWIDSTARPLDTERRMLHLCPRKPKSVWSKVNKERVEQLIAKKRMAPAGLAKIELAKANGSWTALDAIDALEIPADLRKALAKNKAAQKHFDAFPPSAKKIILYWVTGAKAEETRKRRIATTVSMAAKNLRANQPQKKT